VSVDLRHFRSFVVVAQERHIGRAAQRLFITQPALSRQMQQLEREIDAPILVRTARGVELTEAGSALLVHKYHRSEAITEFVEFPGRSHLLMDGEGWEEVAQYIADWLDRVLRPAPVATDEREA
jgi:Bacterial regulatory helix-turn-helix protein, lysR family